MFLFSGLLCFGTLSCCKINYTSASVHGQKTEDSQVFSGAE
uniref:Uncharacterized protein n=1 Tax=Anguilla anguilla TaxID=7936 RepID=A0A0E9S2P4_ANGAN